MKLQTNIPLAPLTTFGIGGEAAYFLSVDSLPKLKEGLAFAEPQKLPVFILGGGSNILVADTGFPGLALHIRLKGMEVLQEDSHFVRLRVSAGEIWDDVVAFAVEKGWWGIENLSAIPGYCGAVAIQNVGAYGQEAADTIESVRVYDRKAGLEKTLSAADCQFRYRKSIFNSKEKDRYIILQTTFRLRKKAMPNIDYPDVRSYLKKHQITTPTAKIMRQAITEIREKKFANPAKTGTAGSFFKNLYISEKTFWQLRERLVANHSAAILEKLDSVKTRFQSEAGIKIPTAFLIDQICRLKGKRIGGAQVSPTQALAIINLEKQATSDDVQALVAFVQQSVYNATGLSIQMEPQWVGVDESLK